MLSEFQNEIIAAIAIFTLIVIFFILKKKTPPVQEQIQEINLHEERYELEVDPYDKQTDILDVEEDLIEFDIFEEDNRGSEEGDFGEELTNLEEIEKVLPTQVQETAPKSTNKIIKKRDLIQHGKITKNNFSEFSGKRILVAEDNLINQKVLTGLLAGSGIEIIIANDGQEALDILEKDRDFLLILMDAHMPRVDGFEATRIIRANPNYDHILVVALSGDTAPDDIRKMKDAGMAEHLEKPLRMETLYNVFYAYTGETKKVKNKDYIEVIMTKELNGDKGLSICGGDEEFYKEILQEFVEVYASSYQELNNFLHSDDVHKADQLLLDVIGVSANIGADRLKEIALYIKDALNDEEEKSYLTLIYTYQHQLEALLQDIEAHLEL